MAKTQEVSKVRLRSTLTIFLSKFIINHVGCSDDRLLRLVSVYTLIHGMLLVYHSVVVILEHHALLVIK